MQNRPCPYRNCSRRLPAKTRTGGGGRWGGTGRGSGARLGVGVEEQGKRRVSAESCPSARRPDWSRGLVSESLRVICYRDNNNNNDNSKFSVIPTTCA